ncbi:MAG: tRNA (adenosine(37)-N6)-threonylcarbamoyltransferase complex dimerization subunit type 1 TsaB [Pseudomonadota bacterium]
MLTLALDTALDHCQAALVSDGAVIAHAASAARGDAEAIDGHVGDVLASAAVPMARIDRVAVTLGPGSFTGVRVGIAYAKGMGLALGVPVAGLSTLHVIAAQHGAPAIAAIDARHGAVFAGIWSDTQKPAEQEARITLEACLALAEERVLPLAGPPSAIAALGCGAVVERLDLSVLAGLFPVGTSGPALTARYLAPVDAAPQTHKALARA